MATVKIITTIELTANGSTTLGKHGAATDAPTKAYEISAAITGSVHEVKSSLAAGTGVNLWDTNDDIPTSFDFLHFWADQTCWLQLLVEVAGAGTLGSYVQEILANVPFVLGSDRVDAVWTSAAIGGDPAANIRNIDRIRLWNPAGDTANYHLILID